ncbi:uncharacterized protein LOC123878588 isoform X2 [Maniola jurtina]|uniref:uncharacterized protein LOC123878588 isoform X2 n=1 Tax=Maniola jurtina TaxID=191418 RepID=UPI001E68B212|nr:uncharacterized protein LOC123878588 isoform X2 [Maniola jurtina]
MTTPVSLKDCAVYVVWLGIFSIYLSLLTTTALVVVFTQRKRRSSILKSQRPPRTPLSELEFNVATPTDTAKSRRVSFSRRTGVAEFVTNEATTTWKNFYEEQNKSLENSGNDSVVNVPRQMSIGHIGKRIFDQQFEEVEIVDIGTLQPKSLAQDFHTSLNNLNITQQLASLECPIDDRKLTAPFQNFELSSLTDHQSKVFRDDFSMPTMPEMTNPIDINFSINPMSSKNDCDDLDEIVKDLGRSQHANVVCPGPFNGGNMSEYIEVDFNMTHGIKKDESEMSITSTIPNPEVQEVSMSISSIHNKRKLNNQNNWIEDKENIAINPYVTPRESKNFTINDSDQILVFDGKKLTVKSEREALPSSDKTDNFRSNLLPNLPTGTTPKRKTIVLNTNDDLPNFMLDKSAIMGDQVESSYNIPPVQQSFIYSESDVSINQAVNNKVEANKRKTIVFEDDMGNISIAKAVPAKVIINKQEKRKTIIYENDNSNISVTQAVPTNIMGSNKTIGEKRKTVVYENDISFTQALPANLIMNNLTKVSQDKTMYYEDVADMSVTQVIPDNIFNIMKNKSNISNISITQAIPSNIMTRDVKPNDSVKTLIFDTNEDIDIELTQAVSDNVLLAVKKNSEKRKSMGFTQDGDISFTQAVPANILLEKTKAIVFEEDGDISVTQAVPASVVFEKFEIKCDPEPLEDEKKKSDKIKNDLCLEDQHEKTSNGRKTIIYNDEAGDISMTQVIPSDILMMKKEAEKMDISSDHDMVDISMTHVLPTNILLQKSENFMTGELSNLPWPNIDKNAQSILTLKNSENNDVLIELTGDNKPKQPSGLHERSECNLSMTKPIPSNIIDIQKEIVKETEVCAEKSVIIPKTEDLLKDNLSIKQDVLVYQALEQSFSQTEVATSLKISPSESESITKESNESLVNKENLTINHSFVTESKTTLDNKNKEGFLEEKYNTEKERVSKKNSAVSQIIVKSRDEQVKAKKSFLNELLDMSNASMESVARNNVNESAIVADKSAIGDMKSKSEGKSNESLFIITRDSDDDENKDNHVSEHLGVSLTNDANQRDTRHQPAIEDIKESDDVQDLHNKIAELKAVDQRKRTSNRHFERVISSDLYDDTETLNKSETKEKSMTKSKKSFKQADNTRELLGMLSDFTEGENEELENEKPTSTIEMKENLAIENKCEPKRLTFMQRRQSIVLSREDLLHNISMAQAALQQSRFEVDENESIEDTHDSPEIVEEEKSRRKSVRISNEVVKTLHFEEDESITEASLKTSPLKKTAFGETSYMKENKAKVIPSYLKDVSDNLKALMSDLVKPMADVIPFDAVGLDKSLKSSVSTCSTQIQANLVTSSQIDVDVELHSNCESVENIKNVKTNLSTNKAFVEKPTSHKADRTLTRSVQSVSISASMEIDDSPPKSPILQTSIKNPIPHSPVKGPIIVFDHHNPLNNVLLAPVDGVKMHKYNPIKSTETMHSEHENSTQMDEKVNENDIEVERLSTHYKVDSVVCQQSTLQAGDNCVEILKDTTSLISNVSKPISIDRSTEGLLTEVKNTEVNTLITMKENKVLLEASSSLTLVDDALARSDFDVKIEDKTTEDGKKSPLRVIYQMETDGELLEKIDSDVASSKSNVDDDSDNSNIRKRSYSPTKRNQDSKSNMEITPKPVNKMQKMSNSVNKKIERLDELIMCLDKMESVTDMGENSSSVKSNKKSSKKRSPKCDKVVVQRVSTEYSREMDKKPLESTDSLRNFDDGAKSMKTESSFTSSKRVREMQDVESASTNQFSNTSSKDCMNWQTDLDVPSSRNLSQCSSTHSNVNVVDKINMLRFMGRECEWESSGSDVWMFRLLRSRIRLTARLSHRHHNAARSRVLADTPLEAVTVDPIRQEVEDPLAAVCIRFAAEAMRYECTRGGGCARAGDVTALLRRCAHVARVALRWARCMRDARYRLAYTITPDGEVTLKVANIRLRSVWEVRLRLELVVGDAQEGAWPRASQLRACAVLADCAAPGEVDIAKLASHLPRDWRHAPATIWTVFRYLKNKTQEDDQFLGL